MLPRSQFAMMEGPLGCMNRSLFLDDMLVVMSHSKQSEFLEDVELLSSLSISTTIKAHLQYGTS